MIFFIHHWLFVLIIQQRNVCTTCSWTPTSLNREMLGSGLRKSMQSPRRIGDGNTPLALGQELKMPIVLVYSPICFARRPFSLIILFPFLSSLLKKSPQKLFVYKTLHSLNMSIVFIYIQLLVFQKQLFTFCQSLC